MTITVANTEVTSTFDYWRVRTNELAQAMTNKVVSVNSNTAVGNAAITGKFTANLISVNSIAITNSTSNINITIPTTGQISNGQYYLNANGAWDIPGGFKSALTTSGTSAQLLDTYAMSSYSAAEYIIRIKNLDANGYSVTKVLSYHDTGNAYVTEYGTMSSNGDLAVFTANTDTTNVNIWITPQPTASTVKFSKVII